MTQDSSYHSAWGWYLLLAAFCVPCCCGVFIQVRSPNKAKQEVDAEKFEQDLKDRKIKLADSQKRFLFQNKASKSPLLEFINCVGTYAQIFGVNMLVLSGLQSDFYGAFKGWTIFYLVVIMGVPAMSLAGIVIFTNTVNLASYECFVQEKNEKIQTMKTEIAERDKHDQSMDQKTAAVESFANQCKSLSNPMVASSVYQDFVTLPSVFLPVTAEIGRAS